MNIFATVLTYTAPSANYRGESAENRSVIQKITKGRFEYPIISPEAIRNALRETILAMGMPCNRQRLKDEEQLAVRFQCYPNADEYADDFFMGWLIATKGRDKEKENLILHKKDPRGEDVREELEELNTKIKAIDTKDEEMKKEGERLNKRKNEIIQSVSMDFKRDSVLRMNLAVALEPYRYSSVFTQSPLNVDSPWKNADSSQLLHRETAYTPFQYPFALNLEDCRGKELWTKTLFNAIGQLNGVAGNHARSYFEMAPASIVVRLTPMLVAGYGTYGFQIEEDGSHKFPEVIEGLLNDDYPGNEFFIGGKIVKDMDKGVLDKLCEKGVVENRNSQRLLGIVAEKVFTMNGDDND